MMNNKKQMLSNINNNQYFVFRKKLFKLITALSMLSFLLSGCSSIFHYGYTEKEWNALSKEQQQKVIKSYDAIIKEKSELVNGNSREEAKEDFIERAVGKHE